jgi:hypothetical protein
MGAARPPAWTAPNPEPAPDTSAGAQKLTVPDNVAPTSTSRDEVTVALVQGRHAASDGQESSAQSSGARHRANGPSLPSAPIPSPGTARDFALQLLTQAGEADQYGCLVNLWNRESGWRVTASNPSGAYGIPQALPGSKMATAGPNWQTNAETQVRWGLSYIEAHYGTPCGAWAHSQSTGWY